jgi:hypothetical protein
LLAGKPTVLKIEGKEVVCCTCRKKVKVVAVPYGLGHIARCPKCDNLAYNGD